MSAMLRWMKFRRCARAFWLVILVPLCVSRMPASSDTTDEPVRRAHYLMGTIFEISAYGQDRERTASAMEAAFAEIRRADEILSNYREKSDLSRLNREGAFEWVQVPAQLYEVLQESDRYSRLTDGAFDVTVSPLVKAWKKGEQENRVPSSEDRKRLLERVGYRHILFDERRQAIRFDQMGTEIDLGGIGKGYAVDRAVAVLKRNGIERALVNAGTSTIYALGAPPGEAGWEITIRDPQDEGEILAVVQLKNQSISTSANSENAINIAGKIYSHIFDPRTGESVENALSTTIISPTATESDALSTAAFILGMDEMGPIVRRLGLAAMIVTTGENSQENENRRIVHRIAPHGDGEDPFWKIANSESAEKGKQE